MLIGCAILIGIVILCGVWYNGRSYEAAKRKAADSGADAEVAKDRVDSLEKSAAEEDARRKERDLRDAKSAADTDSGFDFLRDSFN